MNRKGFTLIELLTVISIISLLANIALANAYTARVKARDAVRISDMRELQKGLELFYDIHGVYPCGSSSQGSYSKDSSSSCPADSTLDESGFLNGCDDNGNGTCADENVNCHNKTGGGLMSEGIINTNCPHDPINDDTGPIVMEYRYATSIDGQSYVLGVYLETNTNLMEHDNGDCDDAYEVGNGFGIVTVNRGSGNDFGPDIGGSAPADC